MKNTTKIILSLFIISIALFQPIENFYFEQVRLNQENYIRNYIDDNNYDYKEVKKLPKKLRPDLKYNHEFLMMRDINLNTIPTDRVLSAIEEKDSKLLSRSYFDRKSEINWTEKGPNAQGGRTRALMLDGNYSSNNRVWAAGVSGGLWYNDDISSSSNTWTKVSDFWDNLEITTIASDPNNSDIIYVGSGEKVGSAGIGLGMWKTTDGGTNWSQLSSTVDYRFMGDMIVRNESGQSVIYIGTGRSAHEGQYQGINGLWRSTDGGSTWNEVLGEISANSNHEVTDIELDADNRLWVGTRTNTFGDGGGQIFFSDDGLNWTTSNTDALGVFDRVFIETYPGDSNILYAMMENGSTGYISWIGKSIDRGQSWSQITIPLNDDGDPLGDYQGSMSYWGSLGIDPNNPDIIYAGAFQLFKSIDSGTSWNQIAEWYTGSNLPYVHADQHNIIPLNSDEILFSNDGGVFLTTDGGNTFSHRNSGLNTTQFYAIAIHPSNQDFILGGTQDNGSWLITGGNETEVTGGDGGYTHIDKLDSNYQFTAYVYNRVYRSTNGGASFNLWYDIGQSAGYFINPSTIDPVNKAFYATYDENTILRQKDYTILSAHDFINISLGTRASAYKVSPHNSGVLFVGTAAGRIFKITDAHLDSYSYEEISPSDTNGYISSIDIGADDNQILITQSNYGIESVYETMSGGGANGWSKVEGDLPDMPIRWGLYNRANFNQVVVATEVGIWVTDDISVDEPVWNPSNDGLANVRVDMLDMNAQGHIAAGTHGRGMFSSPGFSSTAPLNAAFSLDKTSGTAPLTVNLLDRSTGNPTSWQWDFGDGNSSSSQNPNHTYVNTGSYSISLTVSDGSTSDSITKTNTIFVTSVQDTLYSEGFEDCWDQNPDNGRNNYLWYATDANGDSEGAGCYSSSYNNQSTGFLSYEEDQGIGFGAAAADNVSWDDWLHSPEIWLRPGVDNYLKFYAKNLNTNYEESFDVMLATNAGLNISDYTVTLGNETDVDGIWKEYTYDLSQWAGTKIRFAVHHKSQQKYYEFYDYFVVTAGQVSTAGSPQTPTGIEIEPTLSFSDTDGDGVDDAWVASESSFSLFWNPGGESDIAKYNVYASQTEGFTPDSSTLLGEGTISDININIPTQIYIDSNGDGDNDQETVGNANYSNIRSFGSVSFVHDNLNQGEEWFYRVSAIDSDGNETISSEFSQILDSEGPTAGTVDINDIYENSYLRSTSEITVTVNGWSDNSNIANYYMGIGSSSDNNSADVVSYESVTDDFTLSDLTLNDYSTFYLKLYATDDGDNQSSVIIKEFTTYSAMLGDSDNDWDVDINDLNALSNAWPSVDIGPASGSSPYPIPSLDGTADINDISVFSRNWLWTKAQGKSVNESKKMIPIEFDAEVIDNQIMIELPEGITAGRFELSNQNNIYSFKASSKAGYIILENTDNENQYYEFEFGNLSSNDNKLTITVEGSPITNSIEFNYQLFSEDGLAGNGMMQLSNPDEFKLYQNYPNPFSNQTTIKYDIPSLIVNIVDIEIYIYNTLGKLVRIIDEGNKSVGQYTTTWDGKNDDGEKVSSGVYFYQLRAKVDGQSDYNKTMKMVIIK